MKWVGMDGPVARAASHPARGAWIEMHWATDTTNTPPVAPRKGCVD